MKHIVFGIFYIMVLCLQNSCTCNGDIGIYYGIWILDDFTIDGKDADINLEAYSWRFQNNIIQITRAESVYGEYLISTGTWEEKDHHLLLDFTHTSNSTSPEDSSYNPPAELGIPGRKITTLDIMQQSDKQLTLQFVNSEGETLRYVLRKLK